MASAVAQDLVFAALADPTRRRLLVRVAERGPVTATELAAEVPVSRQAVHKHLAGLEAAGLVSSSRAGREVRFAPTPAPLFDAAAWMTTVGAQWDKRLAALERHFTEPSGP